MTASWPRRTAPVISVLGLGSLLVVQFKQLRCWVTVEAWMICLLVGDTFICL